MLTVTAALLVLHVTLDGRSTVAGLPMTAILTEMRELWKPYLDVVFLSEADGAAACGRSLRLLITDHAEAHVEAPGAPSLGSIEFVDHERPAPIITVSARTARTMMKEGRWLGRPLGTLPAGPTQTFLARALGRAIAHEIGHYVLRSTRHSPVGLMRPRLGIAEIMDGRRSHFRLSPDEEALLAVRLAAPEWNIAAAARFPDHLLASRLDANALAPRPQCSTPS